MVATEVATEVATAVATEVATEVASVEVTVEDMALLLVGSAMVDTVSVVATAMVVD